MAAQKRTTAPAQEPEATTTPLEAHDRDLAHVAYENREKETSEPVPAGERPLPYKATVAVSLAVLHKTVGVGTADMLKAVGTLRQGTEVTVTGRNGPFAQLKNGLFVKESFLEA